MRKSRAKRRERLPDPKFNDPVATRFINNMMKDGKKSTSMSIFYNALEIVNEKVEDASGYETWKTALANVCPTVEVKSRRVGGSTFQIPIEVAPERKTALGMKWMIDYSRKRNEKSMAAKLASEIIAASKGEGAAVKKKEDTHRMAEANKAFSHFRI